MQNRLVVFGIDKNDIPLVLAYEFMEADFKINLNYFEKKLLSNEELNTLQKGWVSGEEFKFPDATISINPDSNADSILPEFIRSEEVGKIRNKQNEWAYQMLTNKLWESYIIDLDNLKLRSANLKGYNRALFDDAKSYWERVLEHRKERDISQERLDKIKEDVNSIFEKLKAFRKAESEQFDSNSTELKNEIISKIENIKAKLNNSPKYKELSEELKLLQQENRSIRLTKHDDAQVRKSFDETFQAINEHRSAYFNNKNSGRIQGLNEVVKKMEISLQRDKKDYDYYQKKLNSSQVKPLELQLIKVKSTILLDAIQSKETKIKDIIQTIEKLQKQNSPKKEKESIIEESKTVTEITKGEENQKETNSENLEKPNTVSE